MPFRVPTSTNRIVLVPTTVRTTPLKTVELSEEKMESESVSVNHYPTVRTKAFPPLPHFFLFPPLLLQFYGSRSGIYFPIKRTAVAHNNYF